MQTIIVPLDGSPLAEAALPTATELARVTGATLHLVRALETAPPPAYLSFAPEMAYLATADADSLAAHQQTDARAYLEAIAECVRGHDIRITWEVRVGRAADEIQRLAETIGADLIIMSTHGTTGVRRWVFGSVTNEVLHHGGTPVLVIPPAQQAPQAVLRTLQVAAI